MYYVYAFCTVFQHKFHYNVLVVTRLTCFGNFENLHICICILYRFWHKFHYNVFVVTKLTHFLEFFEFTYIYAFCTILWCKFNYNVLVEIILTCFWWFQEFTYMYNVYCLQCEFNCNYHGCLCSAQNDLFWFHNHRT